MFGNQLAWFTGPLQPQPGVCSNEAGYALSELQQQQVWVRVPGCKHLLYGRQQGQELFKVV
jgi:hypothetical protein